MMPQIHSAAIRQSRFVNRSPIFYGWIIMFVGTLGLIMTSPGQTYSISVFVEYFIGDLGLSRSSVSTIYTVSTLIGSFALPVVGGQIDRRGVRLMMTVIVVLFGLACIYMGFVLNALMTNQWNVTHAAEKVGLQRTNFQALMKKHGIRRPPDAKS